MMGKTFEASVEDPVGVYVKKIRSSPGYDFDIPPRYARQFGERIREAVVYGQAMGFLKGGFLKEIAGEDPLKDLDLSKLVDLKQHSLPQLAQEFERFSIVGVQFPVGSQDEADILKRLIKKECGEPTGDVVVDVQTYPDKVVIRMPRVHGEIVFREYERLRTSGAVEPEYLHDEQDRVVHHPEKKTAWFEKESFPQPSQEDLRELGIREGVDYVPAGRGSVRPASEEAYWLLFEHSAQMDKRKEEEERAERKGERDELLELAHEIHRGLDMRLKRERPKKEKDSRGPVYYFLAGAAKYVAGLFREKTGLEIRARELNQKEADYRRAVTTTQQADAQVRAAAEALRQKGLELLSREAALTQREKAPVEEIVDFEPVSPVPLADINIPEVEASIPRERRMRELKPEETDIEEIIAKKTRKAAGGKPGK